MNRAHCCALSICLTALFACQQERGPCVTEGATRNEQDVCDCPDGSVYESSSDACRFAFVDAVDAGARAADRPDSGHAAHEATGALDAAIASDAMREAGTIGNDTGAPMEVEPSSATTVDASVVDDVCATPGSCDGGPTECTNACGGPCGNNLPGTPGADCSNGLLGACARSGKYECQPDRSLRCTAQGVSGTAEVCDGIDNDCDGTVDEGVLNPCGGCAALPAYGLSCSNGQLGACRRLGLQLCAGPEATACDAPFFRKGNEGSTADGEDNDCDGVVDEQGEHDVFGGGFLNVDPTPCPATATGPC